MTDYGTIKIPTKAYKTHNTKRKEADLTWEEYLEKESATVTYDPSAELTAEITPTVDEEALDELTQEIEDAASGATIDEDAIARAVAKQFDYTMLADKVAEEVEGRLR